ncbi:DnaJ-class molecular chaperone [Streptomyces sp. V3I8]|nr:DnaJ-class molecular chaperone [Streptomyces sp. V3I8]
MAARRTTKPKPAPVTCPDCKGAGEITETVRVGARKGRATGHRQAAMCLTCWGSGVAPADD